MSMPKEEYNRRQKQLLDVNIRKEKQLVKLLTKVLSNVYCSQSNGIKIERLLRKTKHISPEGSLYKT